MQHHRGEVIRLVFAKTVATSLRAHIQRECHAGAVGALRKLHRTIGCVDGGLHLRQLRAALHRDVAEVLRLSGSGDDEQLVEIARAISEDVRVLVLDEPNSALTGSESELLFEVISQRYERGAIIITSTLPFDEWTEVFGSERLTGTILARLTHHVHILEMNGDSYRLNQSKRRSRRANANTPADNPTQT